MNSFLKSPRPSLPLKRAPPLSPSPFPLRGQGMCQPPYSVLKPLRYKVGGPSEVYASSRAAVCGMRPHGYKSLTGCLVFARSLLDACSKFLRKPTSPPLPLREGPPLISVFSPQGRRGNRSSSSLVTISFYGWRTIRGLRQQQSCGLRYATAWIQIVYGLLGACSKFAWCLLEVCLVLARSLLGACLKLFRKPIWISLVLMTEV